MALVSPGVSISINDQSQYVNSNVGSVPLVVLATAANKTNPSGSTASGTTSASAGTLLSFTSQRDLINQMGVPYFETSSTGTPVNGSEINEYGLMAAYSALGLSNQLYAIRADIDLSQLTGTSVRPIGEPTNGTYWLDTANSQWGINVYDQPSQSFTTITPLIINDATKVQSVTVNNTTVPAPYSSVGQIGQYALVTVNVDGTNAPNMKLYYKVGGTTAFNNYSAAVSAGFAPNNTWVEVGSPDWLVSSPVMTGKASPNATIPAGCAFQINGSPTFTTTQSLNPAGFAAFINSCGVSGVYAAANPSNGQLYLYYNAPNSRSSLTVTDISNQYGSPFYQLGIVASAGGTYTQTCLQFVYANYAGAPQYDATSPTGSIWWKLGAVGNGFNPLLYQYDSSLGKFIQKNVPAFQTYAAADYGLDPIGGGINIVHGQNIATYAVVDSTYNGFRFQEQSVAGVTDGIGAPLQSATPFNIGDYFSVTISVPGESAPISRTTAPLTSNTPQAFLAAIAALYLPNIVVNYLQGPTNGTYGQIQIIHSAGGDIIMQNVTGSALYSAGFGINALALGGSGFFTNSVNGNVNITNWKNIQPSIHFQATAPYNPPTTGTLWYYSNPNDIDIMINTSQGWKGYRNVFSDSRAFNLFNTDANGVIISADNPPTSQSNGNALVPGDLWLDSGDLVNFPKIYRCQSVSTSGLGTWVLIDNTDHVSSNGIVFADARWDTSGTTDPISGLLPSISNLLLSNYIDLDAPDWRLYAPGTLLFNTRRSGYNVKQYVNSYFNSNSFPPPSASSNPAHYPTATPQVISTWVSASGLDSNGVMYSGDKARRNLVVGAMQSAVDSNLSALDTNFGFNLLCAPNYPEVIPNLLTLNDNRGDTAFVIGDTPMDLGPNVTDITNWVNNSSGRGLPADASEIGRAHV